MTNQNNNNCSYTYNYHYYNCFNNSNNANNSSGNNHTHDNSGNCDTGTDNDNSNSESRDDSNNEDNPLSGQENLKNTNVFAAYEKAIEGYQFQVGRYNTWMNYYALFVGALFIALYSICTGKSLVIKEEEVKYLLLLISAIGWLASFCWYGALLGYRKWNDHWMKVIQEKEKTLTQLSYPSVYRDLPTTNKSGRRFAVGYISTQKITGVFVFCVILAWTFIAGYVVYSWVGSFNEWTYGGLVAIVVLTALFFILLHASNWFCSSVPKSEQ